MEFLECTEDQIKAFKKSKNLTLSWVITDGAYKVEINGEIVALIDYSRGGMFGKNTIEIDNFEVFKKGQGIGSKIIAEITKDLEGNKIYLYAHSEKSKRFWEKHGFKSINDGTGTEVMCFSEEWPYYFASET